MTGSHAAAAQLLEDERFGWSYERRITTLEEASTAKPKRGEFPPTYPIKLKGEMEYLRIIRIPIELPKYRLANGRTKNTQKEYLVTHPDLDRDLFTRDEELIEAQLEQHRILLKHADEADLRKHFTNIRSRQEEPIILTHLGFVLNGNRRLSVWRELYYNDRVNYDHFQYIQAIWLPSLGEEEVRAIERELQVQQSLKSAYSWHARAQMIQDARVLSSLDDDSIVDEFDLESLTDVDEYIGMLSLAQEYLESAGRHDQWSLLNKSEWGFRALYVHSKNLVSLADRELLKQHTFALIASTDTSTKGSIWNKVRDVKNNLLPIKQRLSSTLLEPSQAVNKDADDWDDLMGVSTPEQNEESLLLDALREPENWEIVLDVVQDELDAQQELKREESDARYLLRNASQAHSALSNVLNSLSTDRQLDGLAAQLDASEEIIRQIRAWLDEHADD